MIPENIDSLKRTLEAAELIRQALHDVSARLNRSQNPSEACAICHEVITDILSVKNLSVSVRDAQNQLIFLYVRDEMNNFQPRMPDPQLAERVLNSGQTLFASRDFVDSLRQQGEIHSIDEPFTLWIGLPLVSAGIRFGVLAIRSDDPSITFSDQQIEFLTCVTNLLAIVLNFRLEEASLKETLKYQSAVAVLSQSAVSEKDTGALMNEAVVLVSRILGTQFCEILELLPDRKNLFPRARVGWMETAATLSLTPATVESLAGSTLFSDVPVIIQDLQAEPVFKGSPSLYEHNVTSGISIRIHRKGDTIGVLGAYTTEQRTYSRAAIYFLETVANILATVIQEKRTEKAVRESQERLQMVLEAQNQVVWDWDLLTDEMWWSDALETVFGYKKAEAAAGFQFKKLQIHPDDREKVVSDLLAFLQSGGKKWWELYRFARADGSYANVRDSGLVIHNEAGNAVRMVGAVKEVSENSQK